MPAPAQENLVPVDEGAKAPEPAPTPAPAPQPVPDALASSSTPETTPAPEPKAAEPQQTEIPFYKHDGPTNAAREDMFKLTGEDPESEIVPQVPESELEPEPQNLDGALAPSSTPQPTEPETTQQPQSGKIIAAGKEFTADQLSKSYTELNKEFHKRNNEHINETRKLQLKLAEVANQNEQRRTLIESAVIQNQNGQNGKNASSPNSPSIGQEDFDKMVEEGKTVEAIGQIVQANMQEAQKNQNSKLEGERKQAEEGAKKERQVGNLQTMEGELKSFKENRQKFAEWAEDQLGSDKVGLAAIANIAGDMPRLKKFYGNFLKSTFDFSQKISEATHKGQTMAQVKQSLQPVTSGGQATPKKLVKAQSNLQPVDQDLLEMEGHLGAARMRPSFFGKR